MTSGARARRHLPGLGRKIVAGSDTYAERRVAEHFVGAEEMNSSLRSWCTGTDGEEQLPCISNAAVGFCSVIAQNIQLSYHVPSKTGTKFLASEQVPCTNLNSSLDASHRSVFRTDPSPDLESACIYFDAPGPCGVVAAEKEEACSSVHIRNTAGDVSFPAGLVFSCSSLLSGDPEFLDCIDAGGNDTDAGKTGLRARIVPNMLLFNAQSRWIFLRCFT